MSYIIERGFIKVSNGAKIMDLSDSQILLDAEHAFGRKFQTEKSTLEVRGHVSTRSSTSSFQNPVRNM